MNWRVPLQHLGILVLYCSLIYLMTNKGHGEDLFGRAILSVLPVGLHVVVLIALAIGQRSRSHLLAAVLVLLIGWSFCTSTFGI